MGMKLEAVGARLSGALYQRSTITTNGSFPLPGSDCDGFCGRFYAKFHPCPRQWIRTEYSQTGVGDARPGMNWRQDCVPLMKFPLTAYVDDQIILLQQSQSPCAGSCGLTSICRASSGWREAGCRRIHAVLYHGIQAVISLLHVLISLLSQIIHLWYISSPFLSGCVTIWLYHKSGYITKYTNPFINIIFPKG